MEKLPQLYLITDRLQLPEGRSFLAQVEELLQAGVRMLQLREKDLTAAELYPLARDLRNLTRRYQCRLLINDRVDLAMAVEAEGVHLAGHSMPIAAARQLLGPGKLIGVSTHQRAEITSAENNGADFVTFGPIFHTPSKAIYGSPVGLAELKHCCTHSRLPVYALGGIKQENADLPLQSGAYGIALISELFAAESPAKNCHKLLKKLTDSA